VSAIQEELILNADKTSMQSHQSQFQNSMMESKYRVRSKQAIPICHSAIPDKLKELIFDSKMIVMIHKSHQIE
jgi:hypothetical protein